MTRSDLTGDTSTDGEIRHELIPDARDEMLRLAALHGFRILDTEPEPSFDELTRLAAQLCGTPMATVTLVDRDRQWFKARVGVESGETSRETSFCSHAIRESGPMVVPDTHLDPRFIDNSLVTGDPHLRAYAGIPITGDGYPLGTLCVLDTVPREFTELQLSQLQILAHQVESQLLLRRDREELAQQFLARARAEGELRTQQALLEDLLGNTDIAIYVKDLEGRFLLANDAARDRFAPGTGTLVGRTDVEVFPKPLTGGFRDQDWLVRDTGVAQTFARELRGPDGVLRHFSATKFPLRDDNGEMYAIGCISTDVTARRRAEDAVRESELRFRVLFGRSPVGMSEALPDGTITDVNDELCRMLGYDRDELIGMSGERLLADPAHAAGQQRDLAAVEHSDGYTVRRDFRRKDGAVISAQIGVTVVRDEAGRVHRLLSTATDITEQVRAERELAAAHAELRRRQIFVDAVLDSIDVGIVACDENARLTVFNQATQKWHGVELTDNTASTDADNFGSSFDLYDDDGSTLTADRIPLLRALRDGVVTDAEMVISPHARAATRVQCTGRAMVDADGALVGAVVAMTDITATRAQQLALQASEARFRATFDNDPAGLAVLTRDARVVQANKAFANLVGRSEEQLRELSSITELLRPEERADYAALVRRAARGAGEAVTAERELVTASGATVWCLLTVMDLPDPQTGRCTLVQVEDITARRLYEQRLTRQAMYDGLTGLPNRVMLFDRIETAVARLQRRDLGAVFALFCDLDGFKAVNDTYGHDAGDHLLIETAQRLRNAVRPADTVARLGGDEFVVLCEELTDAEDSAVIARRIESAVAEPVRWNEHELFVTASIGIAPAGRDATPEDLLRNADAAMYQAKRLGKNGHALYAAPA